MIKHAGKNKEAHNRRRWHVHVKALRQSGLSRAEYCRRHQLGYHAMTYWCRKFSLPKEPASTLVPVPVHSLPYSKTPVTGSPLRLILPGTLSLEIADDFSETTLARVLAVLEHR